MFRLNPYGDYPRIDKNSYVDPTAILIGKIRIGKNVFVAPGAVIRADEQKSFISIGDNCNIQDRVIIHALGSSSVIIGENTSLSHGCIVHGPCKIGKGCFIGFGSVIFKAIIEDNVFIKSLAVIEEVTVPNKKFISNGAIISSSRTVESLRFVAKEETVFAARVIETNLRLTKGYKMEKMVIWQKKLLNSLEKARKDSLLK
jgi:carbonic anhydrase/acetyltransferase-like protein (isoleucine patch superfamily)